VPFDLMVPVVATIGIFAKETGQGLVFQSEDPQHPPPSSGPGDGESKPVPHKPNLKIVK
jgi:stringent starvation protein B